MTISRMTTTSLRIEHINPVVCEGDCEFTMQPIIENPEGGVVLSLLATRIVRVSTTCEPPMTRGDIEILEWMKEQMRELIEKAKKELKVIE